MAGKKYGLILPKAKAALSAPKVGNVFGNDDDSDAEDGSQSVKKALRGENEKNKMKTKHHIQLQKALQVDPTIFQYDEVYDEIEKAKEEEKAHYKVDNKPKYIQNLLKSAELRKKEQELRKDRIIQKEIEAEDNMFPDKERFVTSSYKAKLEESKKFQEDLDYKDKLEAIADVSKQKDMTGFYRHLYRQTVVRNEADLGILPKIKEDSKKQLNKTKLQFEIDKDDPIPSDSNSEDDSDFNDKNSKVNVKKSTTSQLKQKRQYRKRGASKSESEDDHETDSTKAVNESNETDSSEIHYKKPKLNDDSISNANEDKQTERDTTQSDEKPKDSSKNKENEKSETISNKLEDNPEAIVEKPKIIEKKIKIDIWKKRCVGPAFEAACQRYFARKAERLANKSPAMTSS
ncbi:nuclear speckle splicing regulatory protein 1 [Trichogramma pretiosum]|uniref:nuclear speckle splicing regulatory protein 1 n=1 Tax=Trichogramma pretiosum TaxID=7493 RepID=UPI0006C985A5|nr:nuclear speckle splicing regulatory protein 1 [Trichogramma pretiosum]